MHVNAPDGQIKEIVKRNFGHVAGNIHKYPGYSDLNYRVEIIKERGAANILANGAGRMMVLKVLNSDDSKYPECFETQLKMMVHLRNQNLPVPSPVETTEGSLFCRCTITDEETQTGPVRLVSLVDHLPGITFNDASCPSYLLQEIGRLTARMDKALKSFHGTMENESQWKLFKLPEIIDMLLRHYPQSDTRMGLEILSAYKETILHTAEKLHSGIIHGDVNKNNIIVDRLKREDDGSTQDSYYISGLVDFADANSSIYVYELAIVMADMMSSIDEIDPLETGRRLFKGYVEVLPLNEGDLSVLKLCICIRLLQNYVLRSESLLGNPGSEYLDKGREECLQLCRYLWQLSDETFTEKVVCN